MFSRSKNIVFMEAKNILNFFFKSLKIDKNKSQNLAKPKKMYNHSVVRIS